MEVVLVTRRAIARRCRIGEARLRIWERVGLLPAFGAIPPDLYQDRVRLLVAGRRVLTMQALRGALAVGGC
jgi:hypothetical protein